MTLSSKTETLCGARSALQAHPSWFADEVLFSPELREKKKKSAERDFRLL